MPEIEKEAFRISSEDGLLIIGGGTGTAEDVPPMNRFSKFGSAAEHGAGSMQQPMQTQRFGTIRVIGPIPSTCPECGYQMSVVKVDDLRLKFTHMQNDSCSNSNSYFFRPIAQFIVEV